MLNPNEVHYALIDLTDGTWQIVEHRTVPIAVFSDEHYANACLKLLNNHDPAQPLDSRPAGHPQWTREEDAVLYRHEHDKPRNYGAILQELPDPGRRSAKSISGRYARLTDKAIRASYADERATQPPAVNLDITHNTTSGSVITSLSDSIPAMEEHGSDVSHAGTSYDESERKAYQTTKFFGALATPMAICRPPKPVAKTGPESGIEFGEIYRGTES